MFTLRHVLPMAALLAPHGAAAEPTPPLVAHVTLAFAGRPLPAPAPAWHIIPGRRALLRVATPSRAAAGDEGVSLDCGSALGDGDNVTLDCTVDVAQATPAGMHRRRAPLRIAARIGAESVVSMGAVPGEQLELRITLRRGDVAGVRVAGTRLVRRG